MMSPSNVEKLLITIENLIDQISDALISGDEKELGIASSELRLAAVEFSQHLSKFDAGTLKNPVMQLRLKKISVNLASRREHLIRQAGAVDRSLSILVPASRTTTYAKTAGPYGGPAKTSGSFNYLGS